MQAIKDAGLKIPAGGFDVSKEILDDIKNGRLIATVDQQPYSQGFYAVTQLALNLKYGLYPSEMDTGGVRPVDKTNYQVRGEVGRTCSLKRRTGTSFDNAGGPRRRPPDRNSSEERVRNIRHVDQPVRPHPQGGARIRGAAVSTSSSLTGSATAPKAASP